VSPWRADYCTTGESVRDHLGAADVRIWAELPGATVCLAPWADDLACFRVGIDAAWPACREHHLHGLMFALCPPDMQSADVCAQMGQRYGAAALDHGPPALLDRRALISGPVIEGGRFWTRG